MKADKETKPILTSTKITEIKVSKKRPVFPKESVSFKSLWKTKEKHQKLWKATWPAMMTFFVWKLRD
jgi:hypothetical protein